MARFVEFLLYRRVLEEPEPQHRGQHAEHPHVDLRFGDLPAGHGIFQLVEEPEGRLLLIQARAQRLDGAVCGRVVTHHKALEADLIAQDAVQDLIVFARVNEVDFIEGTHGSAGVRCLDPDSEGTNIDFLEGAFTHHRVATDKAIFLLVVGGVVLDVAHHRVLLYPVELGCRDGARYQRIFAVSLERATCLPNTSDIDRCSQRDIVGGLKRFVADEVAVCQRCFGTERRGESERGGQGRGLFLVDVGVRDAHARRAVCHGERRYPEALDGCVVEPVIVARFALQHVDLLVEGHLGEQGLRPAFRGLHNGRRGSGHGSDGEGRHYCEYSDLSS